MTETQKTKISIVDRWRWFAELFYKEKTAFETAKAAASTAETKETRLRRWHMRSEAAFGANGLILCWRAMSEFLNTDDGLRVANEIQKVSDWIADRIDADLPLTDEPPADTAFAQAIKNAAARLCIAELRNTRAVRPDVVVTMQTAQLFLSEWRSDLNSISQSNEKK